MSLIDIEIQSQGNFIDTNNYEQMNFLLAKDDYIETRCGEIFISHCKILIFSCSECTENFPSYEEFFNHLCEKHVCIEDELKYEPAEEDLLDVDYYDDKLISIASDKEQENEEDVKPIVATNSSKETLGNNILCLKTDFSQDGSSQNNEISQFDDELSQDIIEQYEEIEEFDASALVESAEGNKTETFLSDFSKFLEKDYREIDDCKLEENDSTEHTSNLLPNVDPFELDSLVDDVQLTFDCSQCEIAFDSRLKLRAHTKTHTKDRRFKCHICGFAFTEQFNLRSHIKRHSGTKPFECNQCEKKFITKNELKAHVRIHTGERPYICEICGNGFVTSGSLNEHRKRHSNYRPHKCKQCEKSFFDTGLLREHMVVHTGERSHFCNVCQSGFTRRKALLQHLKLHSAVKQYKCMYCEKAFAQKPGLASHLKTHRHLEVNRSDEVVETREIYVDIVDGDEN